MIHARSCWGIALSVVVVALLAGCRSQECEHVRLPGDLPSSLRSLYAKAIPGPVDAQVCVIGDYKIIIMGSAGKQAVILQRGEHALLMADPTYSALVADNVPLATLNLADDGVTPNGFSYVGHDPRTGATVLAVDSDLDGQVELRGRTYPNRPSESEMWLQDRWQVLTKQGSEMGVVVDGKFIPVRELREHPEAQQPLVSK